MADVAISLIAILLVVILLIGVHEFGHFFLARILGIKVLRFSIGFGKVIWRRFDKQGTEYALSLIPLGGYVKMLDQREGPVTQEELSQAFDQQSLWKRLLVILAGPLMNIIFALIAFWLIFVIGVMRPAPVIDQVIPNTPAAVAGIQSGTKLLKIDDHTVDDWVAIAIRIIFRMGDKDKMQVLTQKEENKAIEQHEIELKNWKIDPLKPDPLRSLGMLPTLEPPEALKVFKKQFSPLEAIVPAMNESWLYAKLNYTIFYKMVIGKISVQSLGGPITLFYSASVALGQGLVRFLEFLAIISITIAVINLFPYPGLDGGHALYLGVELLTGKPVSLRIQLLAFRLGLIALCLLFVHIMLNDMMRFL